MSDEEAGEVEEQEEDGGAGQDIMDMLPRTDIRCVDAVGSLHVSPVCSDMSSPS